MEICILIKNPRLIFNNHRQPSEIFHILQEMILFEFLKILSPLESQIFSKQLWTLNITWAFYLHCRIHGGYFLLLQERWFVLKHHLSMVILFFSPFLDVSETSVFFVRSISVVTTTKVSRSISKVQMFNLPVF